MNRQHKMTQKNLSINMIKSARHRILFLPGTDLGFRKERMNDSKNTLGGTITRSFPRPKSDNMLKLSPYNLLFVLKKIINFLQSDIKLNFSLILFIL